MSAAIYVRISRDRDGTALGVKRQEKLCREIAERIGVEVVEVFTDNDVSATRKKARPRYREMLEGLKAQRFSIVIALDSDRLLRRPLEFEELAEIGEPFAARIEYQSGRVNFSTGEGVMEARIRAAVDAEEVDKLKKRVRRKAKELALAGKEAGGGSRPFGFEPDRVTVRESEAEHIRKAVDRVCAGDSLRSIATDWNTREIPTVSGVAWHTRVVHRLLISPRIAGLRQYQGEVVAEAEWDEIVPRAQWERCRAILTDPSRNTRGADLGRKYLLTGGIAVCGLCGAPLIARPRPGGVRGYVCATGANFRGCGKIRIGAAEFESFVGEVVCEALDGPEVSRALLAGDEDETALYEALRTDEALLGSLGTDYADGILDRTAFLAAQARVMERMQSTRDKLAETSGAAVLVSLPTGEVGAAWEAGSLDWRRSITKAAVELVTVHPALAGRNFFDPDRVAVTWRV